MACLLLRQHLTTRFLVVPSTHRYKWMQHCPGFTTLAANQMHPNYRKTFSHIYQECAKHCIQEPGKQAHARMIISGFQPTVFVTNCLIQMYIKCSNLGYADKVFDKMPVRDTVSWNAMIFGYSMVNDMEKGQLMFDLMPERDAISWNSLISGYMQNGNYWKSIRVFLEMGRDGIGFDRTTFAVILKACSGIEDFRLGVQVHGLVVKLGLATDVVTGSAMVDMYSKCKRLDESLCFFNEMPEKNWVSWSALIAGSVQNNDFANGLHLFKNMQKEGVGVSQSTYASVFRSCAGLSDLKLGSQLHGHALKTDFGSDVIVATATLDMYAKCNSLSDAKKVFSLLPNHILQSYNALIVGFARGDQGYEAVLLFRLLLRSYLGFDEISLSGAFSACAVFKGHLEGIQLHGVACKTPFLSNVCVANAIMDMYGKCEAPCEARRLFDEMEIRDAVSWNAIIAAHEQNGHEDETLILFFRMLKSRMEPDEFTYGSVLKACAARQDLNIGMVIHNRIIKSGMGLECFIGSAVIDMYCKCEKVEEAEKLHERMEEQTIISWNAIISGFSLREQSEEAQKFFSKLLEEGMKPDNFTFATVLDTCANLATVGLGKQIHAQIIKQELQSDVFITSTLVDMYSKCGNMQDSRLMFEKAPKKDFVTWNALVCGYAQHGLGEEALQIFEKMQLQNVRPNHATFLAVLRACAHIGLVEKGLQHFNSMSNNYGLDPQLEHYSCMVDILGRAGQICEALKLIQDMPFEADDVIWRTLLSMCKMHGNVEVAEKAAKCLLQLDPEDSSSHILLSNIYADAGMWKEVAEMRKVMRYGGLKKEPGCSWIEIKSVLHMFLVGDKAHPRCNEIYENLDALICEMKRASLMLDGDFLLSCEATEDEHHHAFPECRVSCF
ncbi:pentatricopeptide repeat-containing protein At3g02330, mitochondrial [Lycium barbarum]|uniref:pentatricopeptide repeat-containing protein At3g02330, mitochondrial n=1 Tax=Lycium barbarum TaxID=112863 RepID=UPI00293F2BBF|nr:pentatricopeptide repeat-containing protein At3g02330, mitochondrial [Lycium barbarum]